MNFDVPNSPEDYVHRVGRTARAEAQGDVFLFVSPEEESDLKAIERSIGKRLPRVTLPGFDYTRKPAERLELAAGRRHGAAGMRGSKRPGSYAPKRPAGRQPEPHAGASMPARRAIRRSGY